VSDESLRPLHYILIDTVSGLFVPDPSVREIHAFCALCFDTRWHSNSGCGRSWALRSISTRLPSVARNSGSTCGPLFRHAKAVQIIAPDGWESETPKVLQWGLLLFLVCALVASMAIASVTLFLFWEHNRARNYLAYRLAGAGPSRPLCLQMIDRRQSTVQTMNSASPETWRAISPRHLVDRKWPISL